jgi:hypothetical protein
VGLDQTTSVSAQTVANAVFLHLVLVVSDGGSIGLVACRRCCHGCCRDLLIRRYARRCPVPFRSGRDLGRVPAGCLSSSLVLASRSPWWLPSWLPAVGSSMVLMQIQRAVADEVVVRLTYDEALVLSDLLVRWSRSGFERA